MTKKIKNLGNGNTMPKIDAVDVVDVLKTQAMVTPCLKLMLLTWLT